MKTIIAGSRSIKDIKLVKRTISSIVQENGLEISEVVSGCAFGPDTVGKWWAENRDIPVEEFPAKWDEYGKGAGYRRNEEMAEYADALIAIWDGKSKGTQHMIGTAHQNGLEVYVEIL